MTRKSSRVGGKKAARPGSGAPARVTAKKVASTRKVGATRKAARPAPAKPSAKKKTQKASPRPTVVIKTAAIARPALRAKPAPPRATPATPAPLLSPKTLRISLLEIVRKTSAELPEDVVKAIQAGRTAEAENSNALWAMCTIEDNIQLAADKSAPLCQDTGTILFYVKAPQGTDEGVFRREAEAAVADATARGYLRQNSVDSLTGRNSGNNLGPGSPVIHFSQWKKPALEIRLILKGGGCENMGAQYSLPQVDLGAGRDLAGIEKCVLDAVFQAQGKGCGPGVLGVAIGGDRATGYACSKEQLLRSLGDSNPVPDLASLESRVVDKANQLGIGPMGFGGKTTLLGCKIGVLNRLPASYFVSVSYMCWAYRRQGAELTPEGAIRRWLY
jgi:fumarate hydratase, class I